MKGCEDDGGELCQIMVVPMLRYRHRHRRLSQFPSGDNSEMQQQKKMKDGTDGSSSSGVLPPALYQRMCDIFAPSSSYWKESDYDNRGYYSFFHDLPIRRSGTTSKRSSSAKHNLIEAVVIDHLLPLAQSQLSSNDDATTTSNKQQQQIVGFEWWAHTRPIQANLGHQLHFDTDETLLSQGEKNVTHPIISSVLYLTGNDDDTSTHPAGSTVIFDQTPVSKDAASKAWISQPCDNSFMVFPGDYLHGVLPCRGGSDDDGGGGGGGTITDTTITTTTTATTKTTESNSDSSTSTIQRLTFMVGFWTRRVPDLMEERTLYGPCGPLPPAGDGLHTWVDEVVASVPLPLVVGGQGVDGHALPCISPAWESIRDDTNDRTADDGSGGECNEADDGSAKMVVESKTTTSSSLEIPKSLDHRFFVNDPSNFFRESLFKDESF